MKLADASTYFDRLLALDGYDDTIELFYGQFDLFDDSKLDGSAVMRRIIATGPDPVLPARGVIVIGGSYIYILGQNHKDWYGDKVIREKFVILPVNVPVISSAGSIKDILSDTPSTLYAERVWVKNLKDAAVTSDKFPIYNIFLSVIETVEPGELIKVNNDRYHRVIGVTKSAAGFLACESVELSSDARATASHYQKGTYVAATDSHPFVLAGTGEVIWERFQTFYDFENPAVEDRMPGDIRASGLVSDFSALKGGDRLDFNNGKYRVMAAQKKDSSAVWHMHLRPRDWDSTSE